ncbi:hypothetical protein TWF694_009787 [Orbilia ellipsospora]|uniref:MOSC domain-containing protein n=1 Tax=Orbilia ellipsospora TaxID=2528407 RepID=A0AAV9XD85_9PEZI
MKISQLYIYPVKSLRGCLVPTATLTPQGLKHDRKYMLVRVQSQPDGTVTYENQYLSNVNTLCLFTTSFIFDDSGEEVVGIKVVYHPPLSSHLPSLEKDKDNGGDGGEKLWIEFPVAPEYAKLEKIPLSMHQEDCTVYDMGAECEDFFTRYLGFPTKLVYIGDTTREVKGNVAPNRMHVTPTASQVESPVSWSVYDLFSGAMGYLTGSNGTVSENEEGEYKLYFSDCAPLLVTSEVSLAEFNKARKAGDEELALDMSKTRPNVVIAPSEEGDMTAFEEDYWGELAIGSGVKFVLTANCGRCKTLNVDYNTGKQLPVNEHMLKRLSDMKRRVDTGHGYAPIFGRYGFVGRDSEGEKVRVGDDVEVLKRNKERTVFYWPGLSAGTRPKK